MRRLVHTSTIHSEEVFCMDQNKSCNTSIKCSVSSCTHHNSAKSVCSLSSIQVGCCGPATKECACTECASYEMSKQKSGL